MAKTFFANKTQIPSLVWENAHTNSFLSLSTLPLSLPPSPPITKNICDYVISFFYRGEGGSVEATHDEPENLGGDL